MATTVDMSLDDIIKKNRERGRGRGRASRGRGRGPGRFFNNGRMSGAVRRGPLSVNARPPKYSNAKPTRRIRSLPWQHDLLEDSIRAAGITGLEVGTKLYVSNLDYGVTNEDIRELFAEIGDLKRFAVHYDKNGRSTGSAEVLYTRRSDAFSALKKYNNVLLDGRPMKIEIVGSNPEVPISARVNVTGANGKKKRTVVMTPGPGRGRGGGLNAKDSQSTRNDGSICSPVQSSSPKMKMTQMQHPSSQQQDQLQQQQTNRKRKQHSSSGPANSTCTGNTVGPSPNSPPSTHTPGDGMPTNSSFQHVQSVPKSLMMYGPEGTGSLASSSNILEDMDRFGDIAALDDSMEQFLAPDGDGRDLYGTVKQSLSENQKESSKGFTFGEVGCIRTRNSKVTCCHFSSDGKLLASAGHDMKVVLWNMDTLKTESTTEEHKLAITDVRFRPNSTQLATASVDKSVRLWDANNPSYCLHEYTRHSSPIMSLDFHPKKTDLFCFSDNDNEIRYWNINPFTSVRVSKGGNAQVRFQPRVGHLLAAASDKVVTIFDVESDRQIHSFQGHSEMVNYICWDSTGDILASVSQNLVKIWSMASGECIQELGSNGNRFHSCVFHPSYSTLLVIGGISSLELWNMAENKSMTIPGHENIISALAQSPVTGMVASASHDSSVKLWK